MGNKEILPKPKNKGKNLKSYNHLYKKMLDTENIKECIKKATQGKKKRRRKSVQRMLNNLDDSAIRIKKLIESGDFTFHQSTTAIINESSQKKERLIAKPRIIDQIVHHILMSVFKPIVLNSLYEHVYGSIPGRGPQKQARKYLKKWIKSYGNKRFYVFKYDIRHFYDSIDHDILKNKLQRKIKDIKYLELLFDLIDSYNPGLPKGYYSSQWFANFYLMDLDHYIKNDLKAPHYMRYMDDCVILSRNKRELHKMKEAIEDYLNNKLHLELKDNWQIYRFVDKDDKNGRDIDFMGFRFYRNKITLRKTLLKRIYKKACRLNKKRDDYTKGKGTGVTHRDARSMLSLLGWTKHADVYNWYQKHLKDKINPRLLKKKVAANDRAEIARQVKAGLREPPKSRKKHYRYYLEYLNKKK